MDATERQKEIGISSVRSIRQTPWISRKIISHFMILSRWPEEKDSGTRQEYLSGLFFHQDLRHGKDCSPNGPAGRQTTALFRPLEREPASGTPYPLSQSVPLSFLFYQVGFAATVNSSPGSSSPTPSPNNPLTPQWWHGGSEHHAGERSDGAHAW